MTATEIKKCAALMRDRLGLTWGFRQWDTDDSCHSRAIELWKKWYGGNGPFPAGGKALLRPPSDAPAYLTATWRGNSSYAGRIFQEPDVGKTYQGLGVGLSFGFLTEDECWQEFFRVTSPGVKVFAAGGRGDPAYRPRADLCEIPAYSSLDELRLRLEIAGEADSVDTEWKPRLPA